MDIQTETKRFRQTTLDLIFILAFSNNRYKSVTTARKFQQKLQELKKEQQHKINYLIFH
ncbi:uncharacterized protein DS421_18g609250 [Arachis hypogaea]|nr:uncharacterized protein DS421_18g609250 [Arachis hypogaea]